MNIERKPIIIEPLPNLNVTEQSSAGITPGTNFSDTPLKAGINSSNII